VMLRSGRNSPPAPRLGRFLGEFFRVLAFLLLLLLLLLSLPSPLGLLVPTAMV
jgi:hypothetical protein